MVVIARRFDELIFRTLRIVNTIRHFAGSRSTLGQGSNRSGSAAQKCGVICSRYLQERCRAVHRCLCNQLDVYNFQLTKGDKSAPHLNNRLQASVQTAQVHLAWYAVSYEMSCLHTTSQHASERHIHHALCQHYSIATTQLNLYCILGLAQYQIGSIFMGRADVLLLSFCMQITGQPKQTICKGAE